MKIMYINNFGGGFADFVEIENGTRIEAFFKTHVPHQEASDYLIRVNRQPTTNDYVLQENDRVTITPIKIQGAAL